MPFVNGLWIEPIKINNEKQTVRPSQLNMQYVMGRAVGDTFRVIYIISINPASMNTPIITNSNIDMNSLKESIISKIDPADREYMKLTDFSTVKAVFELEVNKWMNACLMNVVPNNRLTRFEQRFDLKKQVPKMISQSSSRFDFEKFLLRKFKMYMTSHNKSRTWFTNFLPRDITGKIRLDMSTLFDYEYDWQYNKIIGKLKPVYVTGILFATGAITSKVAKGQKLIKIDFEKSVKRKARNFNRKKWSDFINKRYI